MANIYGALCLNTLFTLLFLLTYWILKSLEQPSKAYIILILKRHAYQHTASKWQSHYGVPSIYPGSHHFPHLGDQWLHPQPSPAFLHHSPSCRHKSHRSQLFTLLSGAASPPLQEGFLKPWGAGELSFPNSQETIEKASVKRYIFLRGIWLICSTSWNLAMQREGPRYWAFCSSSWPPHL